jgi:hypothetical protein
MSASSSFSFIGVDVAKSSFDLARDQAPIESFDNAPKSIKALVRRLAAEPGR